MGNSNCNSGCKFCNFFIIYEATSFVTKFQLTITKNTIINDHLLANELLDTLKTRKTRPNTVKEKRPKKEYHD